MKEFSWTLNNGLVAPQQIDFFILKKTQKNWCKKKYNKIS